MSISVTIAVQDRITPLLKRLGVSLAAPAMKRNMGRGVAECLKNKFAANQSSRPNKKGWPRQGFWAAAARSVQQPRVVSDGVVVSVNQPGVALQAFGGIVKPLTRKFLAIPAREEAYGVRPIDNRWSGKLTFAVLPHGGPVLLLKQNVMRVLKSGKRKGRETLARKGEEATTGEGGVMYWLKRVVTIKADRSVLPTDAELQDAAIAAANNYVNDVLGKQ